MLWMLVAWRSCVRLLAFECDRSLKMKSQISLYKSQIISNLHPPTGYAVYIFLHLVFMPQMGKKQSTTPTARYFLRTTNDRR